MKHQHAWFVFMSLCVVVALTFNSIPLIADSGENAGSYTGGIGDNINLFTGGLTLPQTDLYLPGRGGLDLTLTRVYNSEIFNRQDVDSVTNPFDTWGLAKTPGMLGDGWSLLLGKILLTESDTTVFYGDGSAEQIFANTSPGSGRYPFRTVSGNRLTAGRDTLVLLNGTKFIYSSYYQPADTLYNSLYKGRFVTKILDPFGNNIQITYNPGGTTFPLIDQIQDAIGRIVKFEYDQLVDPKTARLKKIKYLNYKDSSPDTLYIKYQYNAQGDLRAVIQPHGDSTIYAYTDSTMSPDGTKRVAGNTRLLSEVTMARGGKVKYVYWLMQERRESGPNWKVFKSVNHWAVYRRIVGEDSIKISYAAPSQYGILEEASYGQIRHKTTLWEPVGRSTEYYFTVGTDFKNYESADSSMYYYELQDQMFGVLPGCLMYMRVTNANVGDCGAGGYFERKIYYDSRSFFTDHSEPYLVVPYLISDKDCGGFVSARRWDGYSMASTYSSFPIPYQNHVVMDPKTSKLLVETNIESSNLSIDTILTSAYDTTSNIFRVTRRKIADYYGSPADKDSAIEQSTFSADLKKLESLQFSRGNQSKTIQYEHDIYGNLTKLTNANGYWTRFVYDDNYHAFEVQVNAQRSTLASDTVVLAKADYYWRSGLRKWEEGANGDRFTFFYDNYNRLYRTQWPLDLGYNSRRGFDQNNGIITDSLRVTNNGWRVTETGFDGFNRVVSTKMQVDNGYYQGLTEYYTDGRVKKSYRPYSTVAGLDTSKYTRFLYDTVGRLVSTRVPDSDTLYDSDSIIYVDARTIERVDLNGRKTKMITDYFGNVKTTYANYASGAYLDSTTALYGPFGKVYRTIPPKGQDYKDSMVYNGFGRLQKVLSPDEGWKEFYYDKVGQLRLSKNAIGTWTYFKYDGLGRAIEEGVVSSVAHPDTVWTDHNFPTSGVSQTISRKYDSYTDSVRIAYRTGVHLESPKGRLTEVYDPTGYNFFFYDQRGRLLKKVTKISGEKTPRIHEYAYTTGDMLDSLYFPCYSANARDSIKYDYYGYGWTRGIFGHTATGAETPGIMYEPFGAVKQLQIGDQATRIAIDFTYDDVGRLSSQYVSNSLAGYGNQIFRRAYNYAGVEISKAYRTNNTGTKTNIAHAYSYDAAGRLFTVLDSTLSTAKNYRYRYDQNGDLDSMIVNGSATIYHYYGSTNRLMHTTRDFFYLNYLYDANGCVTNDSTRASTMGYDYRNLMTVVSKKKFSNGQWGYDSLLNYYDYSGRRVKKSKVTWAWTGPNCESDTGGGGVEDLIGGGGTDGSGGPGGDCAWYRSVHHTFYYYSGSAVSLVVETASDSVVSDWTENIYAVGKRVSTITRAFGQLSRSYIVSDYQGNVQNVFNYDGSGNLLLGAVYWYGPFGKQDSVVQYGNVTQYSSYNDKEFDDELDFGMYYYGARFYDPNVGRFSSPDPLKDYHNPYSYVRNNPIRYIDPRGMSSDNAVKFSLFIIQTDFWGDIFRDAMSWYNFVMKANQLVDNAAAREKERDEKEKNDGPTGGNPSDDDKTPVTPPPAPELLEDQTVDFDFTMDGQQYSIEDGDDAERQKAIDDINNEINEREDDNNRYQFVKNNMFNDPDPSGSPYPGARYDGGEGTRPPLRMPRYSYQFGYNNGALNYFENYNGIRNYYERERERRIDSVNVWYLLH